MAPYHSKQYMAVRGLFLRLGRLQSCKTPEQKFILQIGTLQPHRINERFSTNYAVDIADPSSM